MTVLPPAGAGPAGTGWFAEALQAHPVMVILRGYSTERTLQLAERAWDLGMRLVEVPIQTPHAVDALRAVAAAGAARGRPVGAGTVVSAEDVEVAAEAGARFTVSPGLDPSVVAASRDAGLPTLPGVATPSEVQAAQRLGLSWLKAFPASVLGPGWFRAMAGPFPQVRFVATGGVTATNAMALLAAGASMVAVGSALENEQELTSLAALTTLG